MKIIKSFRFCWLREVQGLKLSDADKADTFATRAIEGGMKPQTIYFKPSQSLKNAF